MVVMFHYVDKRECVIERFIDIEHVPNTTAISLKIEIDKLFSKHGLSISKLRGQGYDGASNMSGEFNGLKSIIMKENEYTFLTLVSNVVDVVGVSSKRRDIIWEKQALKAIEALKGGELLSGRGQNQESGIKRPCDTRLGSHFGTLVSFTIMFSSIIDVLEEITNDRLNSEQKYEASIMLQMVQTYDFVFSLHLVKNILGITNELSQVLQKGDQDIVNAMKLVKICKKQLHMMRDNGWDSLIEEVSNFSCLSPANSFSTFDKGKLIRLAQPYPCDFSTMDIKVLEYQLQTYVDDMHSHVMFSSLKGMVDLSKKLVETKKDKNQMRNKMGDQWLNDGLTVYLEKDVFNAIDNEPIIHRFQNMKSCRGKL
ncbi:uncharacterized protein LOC133814571 [Humulus lupulus]|uniref:uncharacterized protein LOC133814571 n=1 Tax=Humulus lupulus TaxID=3486 RepID=UPI002B409FAD|nr:uncharacterized protein LOC133814571 [Humulus lupulus]